MHYEITNVQNQTEIIKNNKPSFGLLLVIFVWCLLNFRKYDLFSGSPSNNSKLVTDTLLQPNGQKKEP